MTTLVAFWAVYLLSTSEVAVNHRACGVFFEAFKAAFFFFFYALVSSLRLHMNLCCFLLGICFFFSSSTTMEAPGCFSGRCLFRSDFTANHRDTRTSAFRGWPRQVMVFILTPAGPYSNELHRTPDSSLIYSSSSSSPSSSSSYSILSAAPRIAAILCRTHCICNRW